jgi:hypothetical protein
MHLRRDRTKLSPWSATSEQSSTVIPSSSMIATGDASVGVLTSIRGDVWRHRDVAPLATTSVTS